MSQTIASQAPTLSVVFPAYNEEKWIGSSIDAVLVAAAEADWKVEVVVVDDGSTDGTPALLDGYADRHGVVVVHQENRGRFETVRAAIRKASGERVLILGSRVVVDPHSLAFLKEQLVGHPERVVWNGHVRVESDGNPYAGFWNGLLQVLWRRYLKEPRLMSFGIEEFDAFPKGSGFFCAPKEMLESASAAFDSMFDDIRFASDDTRLIRWIAERERIHISPDFSCSYYHGRESLAKFAKHAYFRGTTFIDGYLGNPGTSRKMALAALGAGAAGITLLATRPRTAAVVGLAGTAAAGGVVKACGGSTADATAVSRMLPVFAASFGAGAVRGLLLALKAKVRR
ncbi:glycosyltransferase family A protein [Saccharothrix longispora]|uniref:Glycosyltransferase involved in cell wall biosynthesis n=1 Tax=Saccharothrix longispora TaxID=33920 RepID=A0ABU1Q3Q3_9PSEU|nr:glycosyltransferase family A protein [Saccharothrix longispora]MDR6597533.1 glycosyltransferase involved in cell wall biosynthesis [Saccharothrix longispora]